MTPTWMLIVGAVFLGVATIFFMLIALGIAGNPTTNRVRFAEIAVLSISLAAGAAFIGGSATASGVIPAWKNSTLQVSLTGGAAILILTFVIANRLYPKIKALPNTIQLTVVSSSTPVPKSVLVKVYFDGWDKPEFELEAQVGKPITLANVPPHVGVINYILAVNGAERKFSRNANHFDHKVEL